MATRPLAWTLASLFVVVAAAACGGSSEEAWVETAPVSTPPPPSQERAIRPCPRPRSGWRALIPRPRCSNKSARRDGTPLSHREVRATRLVKAQVGNGVKCRDNGAVNTYRHPDYYVGYSCYDKDGYFYNAVVSADGVLMSLSGPHRLKWVGP
jgi:hypothetical protein